MTANIALAQEIHLDSLPLKGQMPSWLCGTLIRNGPSYFDLGENKVHWLDGLAMLHCFSFQGGKVSYTNKFLRSDFYHSFQKGKLPYKTFASDPCQRLFRDFFTSFKLHAQNANVNITKIAEHFLAVTEVPLSIEFDPKTLETLGVFQFEDDLAKAMRFESAHPHYDFEEKRSYNYYTKWSKTSSYNLFAINQGEAKRQLIAKMQVKKPAYMHTFAMTKNYFVLTEFPFVVSPLDLLLRGKPFIENFKWEPKRGTSFQVFEKASGKHIKTLVGPPFFAFHHINAFEEGDHIILDLIAYEDPSVIWASDMILNYQKNILRINLDCAVHYEKTAFCFEMPKINPRFNGRPYKYAYGVGPQGEIVKAGIAKWQEDQCLAGEPIFIESPKASEEDDGVLATVVLDQKAKSSFLLILDAKNLYEIARAEVPHQIPFGLHGQYYSC